MPSDFALFIFYKWKQIWIKLNLYVMSKRYYYFFSGHLLGPEGTEEKELNNQFHFCNFYIYFSYMYLLFICIYLKIV